jgi:hypothetical protein
MIALTESSSSTHSATASFFAKLPIEILQHIAEYLRVRPYVNQSKHLLSVLNLLEAYPSVFPFLKCFKELSDAGMAKNYPCFFLYDRSPSMTTELLESLIQSEPQKLTINSKKYFSTVLFAQFRKRTKVELWLAAQDLNSHDINQIASALQFKNNNITKIDFFRCNLRQSFLTIHPMLTNALQHRNNRVERLIVMDVLITFECASAIAIALLHPHCKLTNLELSDHRIWSSGNEILMNAAATIRKSRKFELNLRSIFE